MRLQTEGHYTFKWHDVVCRKTHGYCAGPGMKLTLIGLRKNGDNGEGSVIM